VLLCVGSANRDERAFTDADSFDISRDRGEAQHLELGYGVHSCPGAALACMESVIALDMLLDFMPRYEVLREGLSRVAMTNVISWHNVPVRVLPKVPVRVLRYFLRADFFLAPVSARMCSACAMMASSVNSNSRASIEWPWYSSSWSSG
jgi:hypothetical protein